MATTSFELQAESRTLLGKANSRRMRRIENKIPGVIYGAQKDTTSVTLDHNEVLKALEHEAFYSQILTVTVDGKKKEKVILRDIQRHVYKPKVLHMDFQRIKSDEALKIRIPIHFLNEDVAPGIKLEGGVVSHHISDVEISCLPADLPEFLSIDLAELKLDESIYLSQIVLPKGVTIVELTHGDEHDQAVVSIHIPQEIEEDEVSEEETLEAAESEEDKDGEESDS